MTDETGKLAHWLLRLSKLEFDAVHRAGIKHQTAEALSRFPTTGNDKMLLNNDVPVLTISRNAMASLRSSTLMIVTAKSGCHTKSDGADDSDVFTLQWYDTRNTDRTGCKHILALPEVLRIANSPDLDRRATTNDLTINQANGAYCNRIASHVGRAGSLYLFGLSGILLRQSEINGALKKLYPLYFVLGFCICPIIPS